MNSTRILENTWYNRPLVVRRQRDSCHQDGGNPMKTLEKLRKGNGGMEAYLGNKELWIRGEVNALNDNTGKYTG